MSKYYDADEVEALMSCGCAYVIRDLPTIEVSEGEWIVSEDGDTICSVCGASEEEFIFGTENWYGIGISNYCPNCGAIMKGEE